MKTDIIEKNLRGSTSRQKERLALWSEIKAAWGNGETPDVEDLLGNMAASLEERRSQISERLAREVGISDGDNQES